MNIYVIISFTFFLIILGILVFIRAKSGNRYEIKNADIVVALLPVVIFLIYTGKISSFQWGDLRIETAFKEASQAAISAQITEIPVEHVATGPKGAVSNIPKLIAQKTEALTFNLGYHGYWGPAIEQYVKALSDKSLLKYLVINNEDGTLFGILDAGVIAPHFLSNNPGVNASDFADWLGNNDTKSIQQLPDFISSNLAVDPSVDKRRVLDMMEEHDLDKLPAVNDENQFLGMVNRSRLIGSLILDVTKNLDKKNE